MYELVIYWTDNSQYVSEYPDRKSAEDVIGNLKLAFGNQILWYGIIEK